ncbi:MAG: S8 family serine peptidase, partial [Leptolyngbyaceae cyanobacterium]
MGTPNIADNLAAQSIHGIENEAIAATLADALFQMWDALEGFSGQANVVDQMAIAFGPDLDADAVYQVLDSLHPSTLPIIEIRNAAEINGAQGAFAAATNTIYLSQEFLVAQQENPAAITSVLLEEVGHLIDSQLNATDSPGDEGAIFSALVQGKSLTATDLNTLYQENDGVTVELNGVATYLEQNNNPAFALIDLYKMRDDERFKDIDGVGPDDKRLVVAVLDGKVDTSHSKLKDNIISLTNPPDGSDSPGSHGTHVAGTVASSDSEIGVAPKAGLIALDVFKDQRNFNSTDALEWLSENQKQLETEGGYNIVAVNMSLGSNNFFTTEEEGKAFDPEDSNAVQKLE